MDKEFPEDTLVQFVFLPAIQARLTADPRHAIEILRAAIPYELGYVDYESLQYAIYVRGQAYLAAHQADQAAAEFEKIIRHRSVVLNAPIGALAHLGLARARALQGDTGGARSAYRDFLSMWRDADAGNPILKQARAEYGKLN